MATYSITSKPIFIPGLVEEIKVSVLASLYTHITGSPGVTDVHFTETLNEGDETTFNSIVTAHSAYNSGMKAYAASQASEAMTYGRSLISLFGAENSLLGIEAAGMTRTVRLAMADVAAALFFGALLDAIAAMREVPVESYDGTFITEARILSYINKCEDYLGLTRSTEV